MNEGMVELWLIFLVILCVVGIMVFLRKDLANEHVILKNIENNTLIEYMEYEYFNTDDFIVGLLAVPPISLDPILKYSAICNRLSLKCYKVEKVSLINEKSIFAYNSNGFGNSEENIFAEFIPGSKPVYYSVSGLQDTNEDKRQIFKRIESSNRIIIK